LIEQENKKTEDLKDDLDVEQSSKKTDQNKTPSKSNNTRGGKRQQGKTTSKQSELEEGGTILISVSFQR